ncbi:OsmC family protein [Oceanospirillaceae bacterium]|jgi:putative redox protein|uniref:OsmC family protein n=1 Tax=Candidatus Njordibacter sp. Uisw_002 TaxID=3230971 RepID=UPI0023324A97|nr:OsmC family protein [Oceanospirillaceae bacterium]MDC1509641.1 OsmC family protein [Oceanospirillaceae bacterium]|tara:strand:- start:2140 stop:2565 length:426 start_codon:yes stop_codon:yes gene_type:complete
MQAKVSWAGGVSFSAESGSGHTITLDGPPNLGGENLGARPMELILMGLGGCTAFDVMTILKKTRQDVTDCVAQLSAERADAVPSVFTNIHVHFVVTGHHLKDKHVARAIKLSAEEYCSASIMLEKGGVTMTHGYEIVELDT